MKSARIPYQIAVVLLMLLCTTPTRAQLSTGGDVAGGYLWIDPHLLDSRLVRADLGCGWLVATNFRFMGGYQTIASRANLTWQSSTVSIEKRFKPVTLYLTANRLVDPSHILRKYNSDGYEIYENISRSNNRIVMLGCRWGI